MEFQEPRGFFVQKRNIIALIVWSALVVALVVGVTVNAVFYRNDSITEDMVYRRLMYALLCFVMISLVFGVEKLFRIRFSLFLELFLMFFAFFALAGGTVFDLYGNIPVYDKILHTVSGPLFAIFGMELGDILLKPYQTNGRKAVICVIIGFFCALAIGYLWEIFEYTIDTIIPGYDNQKWLAGVVEELGNGTYITTNRRGTALIDTMSDMIFNLVGAVAFLLPTLVICVKNPKKLRAFHVTIQKKEQ